MAKRKARFNSLSTPGTKQDLSNYLVELVFLRQNKGIKLPKKFWQLNRYKFRYRREIQACRKFIKNYGEPVVLHIALKNYITSWTDYAKIEFLAQARKEAVERANSPKDLSPVVSLSEESGEDLRENKPTRSRRRGLFAKIEEIEND